MEEEIKEGGVVEIRDNRGNKRYFIDDVFDNVYARVVGPYAYAVYGSLCKHADKRQKAWPGIDTLAERLGMGRKSVFASLEILEFLRIIKRDRIGKKCTNRYTLLDRTRWVKPGSVKSPIDTSLKNSEVPLRYFTSPHGELHEFLTGTSTVRKPREGNPEKDAAVAADSVVNNKCKTEECKKNPMKGKEFCSEHQPMDLPQFVKWCSKSSQKHVQIIGDWAETVTPDFQTVAQWEEYISRYSRMARKLEPFDRTQLEKGFADLKKAMKAGWLTVYTLETLYKFVTGEKVKV